MSSSAIADLTQQLNDIKYDTPAAVRLSLAYLAPKVAIAASFSAEDIVLIDLVSQHCSGITVLAVDTGRLPEETYQLAEIVRQQFNIRLNWLFPAHEAVENLLRQQGSFGFRQSLVLRQRCCQVRKVDVLKRGLSDYTGWYTGQRREQSQTRCELQIAEPEQIFSPRIKINPLAFWTKQAVWDYIEQRHLPVHKLYRQGYTSIGCAPCTRAVVADENDRAAGVDERAGRWWWERPVHRECGIHRRPAEKEI